jgi:hypothetical protein
MKKLFRISLLISILFLLSMAASAQTRVNFAPGATSAVVTGQLNGFNSRRVYLIRVRRGQRLRVEQIGSSHLVSTTLEDPTGEDVSDMDASCNSHKDVSPTRRGDYTLTVGECRKADRWRGKFRLRIRITG